MQHTPDGWQQLVSVCGDSERMLLQELRERAKTPPDSVADFADLVTTAEELAALAAILARAAESAPQMASRADSAYERHKQRAAARQARISREAREIGPLPPVRDPERKEACRLDLQLFYETYEKSAFPLPWSDDHLQIIHRTQVVVLAGALKAVAMPRGSGKTTLFERAVIWTQNYGHRMFAMLIAATDGLGEELLFKIRSDQESNPLLLEDFPEVCYPLAQLGSIHNKAKGQLLDGRPTRMRFGKRLLVLPDVAGSPAAGSVIKTAGLLSALRGANHRLPDGTVIRPDLVLLDDPQTRESAESTDQSATRTRIVGADVLGLAGPEQTMAALMACTVVAPGDMCDTILDRELHPDWRGDRTKMLLSWPEDMDLWEEYDEIRRKFLKEDDEADAIPKQATRFYLDHQTEMDAGAEVTWEHRHPGAATAIQFAMTLYFRDPLAFSSEYQNEPYDPSLDETFLTAQETAKKTNSYRRRQVPQGTTYITAFCDVHKRILYYTVIAWEPDFTGYVLDYGVWPKQNRQTFVAARARPTLMETYKGHGTEGAIYAGLKHVADDLLGRVWHRDDGAELSIDRMLIDGGYDTTTVRKFCREHESKVIMPSFGKACGENEIPISQYRQRPGELIGHEWLVRKAQGRGGRHVLFDTNFWKSFFHRRLATPVGDSGALTIFGRETEKKRAVHEFFARHLDAEIRNRSVGRRAVDKWEPKPGTSENHWFDCVVGSTVAASLCGCRADAGPAPQKTGRRSLADMAAAAEQKKKGKRKR